MGLEAVREEILENARKQEEALLAEARAEADRIVKKAQDKVAVFREKIGIETKKAIEAIMKQEKASAELEGKKMTLEAKKDAVERAFEEARKKIGKLSGKKREEYTGKLLEKAKKDIDVERVYCSEKDAKLVKGVKVEPLGIIGGLIAENADGTVRVDYSFDTILQGVKENELQGISKILFG